MAEELGECKRVVQGLQEDLVKAKEAVHKGETFKEVARTKEAQMVKDHETFEG